MLAPAGGVAVSGLEMVSGRAVCPPAGACVASCGAAPSAVCRGACSPHSARL